MAQPVSYPTYKPVIAAGTTVVSDQPVNLSQIIVNGTFVGSVEFYDATTTAGTAAGNLLWNLPIPTTNINKVYSLNFQTRKGLVVVATGTPTLAYTID